MTVENPATAQTKVEPAGTAGAAPAAAGNAPAVGANDAGKGDKAAGSVDPGAAGGAGDKAAGAAGKDDKGAGAAAGEKKDTPDEKKDPATTDKKDAPKESTGAPETYELALKENSALPAKRIEEIAAEAKEAGLSNEAAQKLLAREEAAVQGAIDRQQEGMKAEQAAWAKSIKEDPMFQGEEGARKAEISHRLVEKFGDPELKAAMASSGLGNYPPFVKFMTHFAEFAAEDRTVTGGTGGGGEEVRHADVLFGKKGKRA